MLIESASRLRTSFLEYGASAIELETKRLLDPKGGLEAELKRIRSQESLDAVDELPEEGQSFFEGFVDADTRAESEAPGAFDGWLVKRLQFGRQQHGDAVQYIHLSGDYRQTLVPIGDAATHFHALVDRRAETRRRKGELPFTPGTFSRTAAERAAIPLFRVGHPFVASVEALVRSDDRGAAFAMWRIVRGLKETRLFLRFDFVIEADLSKVSAVVAKNFGLVESLQRRVAAAFPVQHRTVWLDSELRELRQATPLLERLERPYRPAREGGVDVNLRPDRWPFVDLVAPVGDWEGLCLRARQRAEERIRRDAQFTALCRTQADRVLAGAAEAADVFRNRLPRLTGAQRVREEETAQFEEDIAKGIAEGIGNPVFRVDAAGAVFLSGSPLPEGTP
jgi:ATP-dependent helicase HepA